MPHLAAKACTISNAYNVNDEADTLALFRIQGSRS